MQRMFVTLFSFVCLFIPNAALASTAAATAESSGVNPLSSSWLGYISIAIFVVAYILVVMEEFTHMRKSKPVLLAAGIIWMLVAIGYGQMGQPEVAEQIIRHTLLEYGELFLFLLVAMTYINSMEERQVFTALRSWMVRKGFSYRQLFWMTGILSFFISPIADNLTTALLMCAVVMAVARGDNKFIGLCCINIVVAANAGGAFSPFGDITTLMVWQKGLIEFKEFFYLFIPSVVNYLIPATIMFMVVPKKMPNADGGEVKMKRGALIMIGLFIATIATAVCYHQFLHLPPTVGMMTGLAYLKFLGFYLKKTHGKCPTETAECKAEAESSIASEDRIADSAPFNVFSSVAKSEWDTLLFFYGVMMCVGGLGALGYLDIVSNAIYIGLGATTANVLVGLLSALVDNIPVMFAVLTMNPDMSLGEWQLVTLTAGVGGSLLSVGSAAGVALMGASRGAYTFFGHMKWLPVIALGYAASIYTQIHLNSWALLLPPH